MNPRIDPSSELLELAAAQAGVVSVEQAARTGLGRHSLARLVAAGRWRRIGPGLVFMDRGEPPWLAQAWAGVLAGGRSPGSVVRRPRSCTGCPMPNPARS